jgi:bifunctional oligoribonuclease and PAP phosphatase NrnA
MTKEIIILKSHLETAKNVLIISHRDPDIDSIGSSMAVMALLEKRGVKVCVWSADNLKEEFDFIPGSEKVVKKLPTNFKFDTIIALDSSDLSRIKKIETIKILENITIINIDHHPDNSNFGTINIIDSTASSTGEIVYNITKKLAWDLTANIATCLYASIVSDTGRFLFNNTSAKTLATAADLVEKGANPHHIAKSIYEELPIETFDFMKIALDRLVVDKIHRYAYTSIPRQLPTSAINIIDFIRQIRGIEVFMVFTELKKDLVKISLRSKTDFDVSAFASHFNGGGHKNASGIRVQKSLKKAEQEIISKLTEELNTFNG